MIGAPCNSVYFITCVYSKRYPEKGSTGFSAQLQDSPWYKCALISYSPSMAQAEISTACLTNVAEGDTVQQAGPLVCLAIFLVFLSSQKILLGKRGTSGHLSEKNYVMAYGSTRHRIFSSSNVGHTGQPPRSRSLVVRELPLAYGKMRQDDRYTALFKSRGSYWYKGIKPLVVGKGSEVYLVTPMLNELGDIISHFLSTLIEGIIHMTHNSLT